MVSDWVTGCKLARTLGSNRELRSNGYRAVKHLFSVELGTAFIAEKFSGLAANSRKAGRACSVFCQITH